METNEFRCTEIFVEQGGRRRLLFIVRERGDFNSIGLSACGVSVIHTKTGNYSKAVWLPRSEQGTVC